MAGNKFNLTDLEKEKVAGDYELMAMATVDKFDGIIPTYGFDGAIFTKHFYDDIGETTEAVAGGADVTGFVRDRQSISTTVASDTQWTTTGGHKVSVEPYAMTFATILDRLDVAKVVADPKPTIHTLAIRKLNREREARIVAALNGWTCLHDYIAGALDTGARSTPSKNQLLTGMGTASFAGSIVGQKNLTFEMLVEMGVYFEDNHFDSSELYVVGTPRTIKSMLLDEKGTSQDYIDVHTVMKGKPTDIGGFRFISLPATADNKMVDGVVYAFAKEAILFVSNYDRFVDIEKIAGKNHNYSYFVEEMTTCTLRQPKGVLKASISVGVAATAPTPRK